MKKLSLAYFGSPDFSAIFLEKLILNKNLPLEIKFVVTRPDKPVGRNQTITQCPVKQTALKYNLPVFEINNFKLNENLKLKIKDLDLALLYAYGKIIPTNYLSLPKLGFWNIHPSLLPKYRGPAPIAAPLIKGDTETGITIIKLVEELDAGPIIAQKKIKILPFERRPDLVKKLNKLAYDLFIKTINKVPKKFIPQNEQLTTYTKLLEKDDGFIPLRTLKEALNSELLSHSLFNKYRGLYPWPGIWTVIMVNNQEKRLKITDVDFVKGKLILKKTQLEGKKEVDFQQFNAYYKVF